MDARLLSLAIALSLSACSSTSPHEPLPSDGRLDLPVTHDGSARSERPLDDRASTDLPRGLDLRAPDHRAPDLASPDSKPTLPQLPVFILAGQSNMVGLGYNSELSPADKTPVANTTLYYNDSVHPNPNTLKWMPLAPGFGVQADRFGPELSFGRRLRELWPKPQLALIKVAEGGTALHDRWAAKNGDLYKLLVSEVKQQLAVLGAQAKLTGMIWMQGESDGTEAGHANAYQANLIAFVGALRQDLGVPSLPFTAGLISLRPEWPYATTVRAGTIAAIGALAPMNVVETADLPTHASDPVHYTSASNLTLGRRFANAAACHHASGWSFPIGFGPGQGAGGWGYRDRLGAAVAAMSWDPTKNRWVGVEAGVFVGDGWMHPGSSHAAELTWTSPIAGAVTVDLTIASADNTGGDGTVAEVAVGTTTVYGPTAIAKKSVVKQSLKLSVQQGSLVQFRTSAGPLGNPSYDTTSWEIAIAPAP